MEQVRGLQHDFDQHRQQTSLLVSENKTLEAKVKATSMFKLLLQGLKNELEQQ